MAPHPLREGSTKLTSPHAAGEAADGRDRARDDGAPGDGGNSATGEHFGGGAGAVEWSVEGVAGGLADVKLPVRR